jgi:hypothetical protein
LEFVIPGFVAVGAAGRDEGPKSITTVLAVNREDGGRA